MTLDQIKELRQALEGGDAAFESTFTPETCTALLDHISQLEQNYDQLVGIAHNAVRYVGSANYAHRKAEAHQWIDDAAIAAQSTKEQG